MAVYQVPQQLKDIWDTSKQSLIDILASATIQPYPEDRLSMFTPAQALGNVASKAQQGIPQGLADLLMQGSPEQAMSEGISGLVGPMQIAENFRSPEMIRELRRIMAEENKARGAMSVDAMDQILRGSWFHGMRPEAREKVFFNLPPTENLPNYILDAGVAGEGYSLPGALHIGLPGSTHATPSYVRFGEPYGTSITASPPIAQRFSADDYIHRVMPLYGGPPTERIIPMWRPEGAAAMNEGYNEAFNQWLIKDMGIMGPYPLVTKFGSPNRLLAKELIGEAVTSNPNTESAIFNMLDKSQAFSGAKPAAEFNTLYSKALQDKGYRGILYSPERFGEYEMLMLDPSYVKPLDYRPGQKYTDKHMDRYYEKPNMYMDQGTPRASAGYDALMPEFEPGISRLSDVFNQMPWIDRINQENKLKLLEFIDPQYREAVGNMLMGR